MFTKSRVVHRAISNRSPLSLALMDTKSDRHDIPSAPHRRRRNALTGTRHLRPRLGQSNTNTGSSCAAVSRLTPSASRLSAFVTF